MSNNDAVPLKGDLAVPILISHKFVKEAPKVEIRRKFQGLKQGLKNIAVSLIEFLENHFWEEERTVSDPEDTKTVFYALDIETDDIASDKVEIIASRIDGKNIPACGIHFQVVKQLQNNPDIEESTLSDRISKGVAKLTAQRPKPLTSLQEKYKKFKESK